MEKYAKIERMENKMATLNHDHRKLEDNDSYERRKMKKVIYQKIYQLPVAPQVAATILNLLPCIFCV